MDKIIVEFVVLGERIEENNKKHINIIDNNVNHLTYIFLL
jgi:hypothetical protein